MLKGKKHEPVTPEESKLGEALRVVNEALAPLDAKARLRVVRAVCAFYGIPVPKEAK